METIAQKRINDIKNALKDIPKNDLKIVLCNALRIEKHKYDLMVNKFVNSGDSCFNFPLIHFKYNNQENAIKDFEYLQEQFKEIKSKNTLTGV